MRLADVLDNCAVCTVTVAPEVSLADAARVMHKAGAKVVLIVEDQRLRSLLTKGDILRPLTTATSPLLVWDGPLTAALTDGPGTLTSEETLSRAIAKMNEAGSEFLPVMAEQGIVVVSLGNLLLAENAFLRGEVQHLQSYIDALHDAPND
jgi:CBS domain-containing protein